MVLFEPPPVPVPPVLISRQDAQQPAHAGGLTLQPLPKSRLPSASYPWAHMDLSSHSSKAGTPKAWARIHITKVTCMDGTRVWWGETSRIQSRPIGVGSY